MRFSIIGFRLIMVVCLSTQMSGVVQSIGTLELRMNNFRNPSGHRWDGLHCDAIAGQCDNIFQFGLDQSTGSTTDPQSCYYLTKTTTTYQHQNSVDFTDNMNGISNPINWNFDSWPGSVLFKVYIEDADVYFNDYLDGMVQTLTLTPARSRSRASATTITIYGLRYRDKTTLSMTYKCYCNDNYYGPTCSIYCFAHDSNAYGHYTCNPFTGAKICRPGWEDVSKDCKTFADDCVGNGCLNGAKCVDGIRSYTCACIGGYTGSSCETNINECASSPCLNGGTCSDLINAFTCSCTTSRVGPRCAETACVALNPCLHGGTCYDDRKCFCMDGYAGSNCEMTKCQAVPCINGGTCSANGTCICPTQFIRTQCEQQSALSSTATARTERHAPMERASAETSSGGGMLFIILITMFIILFIIAVLLVAFLVKLYRRRRDRGVAEKRPTTASTAPASSTISTLDIGSIFSSQSTDDVTQPSRKPPDKRWKSVGKGLKERRRESNRDEESSYNQYETLEGGGGYSGTDVDHEYVRCGYEVDLPSPRE